MARFSVQPSSPSFRGISVYLSNTVMVVPGKMYEHKWFRRRRFIKPVWVVVQTGYDPILDERVWTTIHFSESFAEATEYAENITKGMNNGTV